MRPRPFGRGIAPTPPARMEFPIPFNEAATFRPRNPTSRLSRSTALSSFNEAATFRPRNRRGLLRRAAAGRPFNEAATFRPRNPGRHATVCGRAEYLQ